MFAQPVVRATKDAVLQYPGPATWLGALGLVGLGIASAWSTGVAALAVVLASAVLAAFAFRTVLARGPAAQARRARDLLAPLIANDQAICLLGDPLGEVALMNKAAQARLGPVVGRSLVLGLAGLLPDQGALLIRLQNAARDFGEASQQVDTPSGALRITVRSVGLAGCLWRIEAADPDHAGQAGQMHVAALPILRLGADSRILDMNAAMRALLGRSEQTIDRVLTRLPPEAHPVQTIATRDGPASVRVHAAPAGEGQRDIVILPAGDDDIPQAASRVLFDGLPVGLVRMDPKGRVLHANPLARDLLGLEPAAEANFIALVEGLGRPVADWLADAVRGRALGRGEVVQVSGAEAERYLQVTLGRVLADGEVTLIAVLQDATELKTLEAQFVQSQKMQAIGQLAGGIAHDFNNLLTAISGHCDLLLLRHDDGDPDFADLVQISQNANRAAGLVGQLLAYSRKQRLSPEVLDLRETLADLTHLLNRLIGEPVRLKFDHAADLAPVRADKRQLEQVIVNLVVNARDAMRGGGEVRIETANETLADETRRGQVRLPKGDYVVIRVIDTGHGIPPDKRDKIFEPFFTTKRTGEGTGLGLSTVYGIIKQTGGFIFVDSTEGEGTIFSIYLPAQAHSAATAAREPAETRKSVVPRGGVVMLVEDEAPVRAFASRALRMQGYQVIEAASAEEALDRLKDPGLHVDLFVSDVVMPGRDGPSWVAEARKDRPDVGVVFVSGYAEDSFARAQAEIGDASYLSKPFSLADLTAEVEARMH